MYCLTHQFVSDLLAELVYLLEVPGGRASQGRRVLHQHHLAAELGERHLGIREEIHELVCK